MKSVWARLLVLLLIASVIIAFFILGGHQYLTFESIKESRDQFQNYYEAEPLLTIGIYMLVYIVTTALSLPGAAILTLLGGALFGLGTGLIIVSFASTIGATLAFLAARFILKDWVQSRFKNNLRQINERIEKDGAFYLFTLRLIPVVPFFVINLVMGLTPIKTLTFFIVSQIGMLPGTFVYVNAGTQLGQLESPSGILSLELLISFVLLGLFPLLAKRLILPLTQNFTSRYRARKLYSRYKKPKKFDYNVIAIGGGSAGLVTAYISAAAKARVALIEKHKMGGDCLNTGCIPSKSLIRTGKFLHDIHNSQSLGVHKATAELHFPDVMDRVHRIIKKIEPHDSVERYSSLGVECFTGEARILSPWEVEVNGQVLTTKNIVIATGARPVMPNLPGLKEVQPLTSENLWELRELPKRLLVLGAGPIGLELAQAFARIGSQVILVDQRRGILAREDEDVSEFITQRLIAEGIQIHTGHQVLRFSNEGGQPRCHLAGVDDKDTTIDFDRVLVAVGRRANTEGLGLEDLGIETTKRYGTVKVDPYLRSNYPNIYACGDVAGPFQFTHTASHQAWFCAVNSMISPFYAFEADYRVIPWCTYTDPEIAHVGFNEKEANERGISYEVSRFDMAKSDRALTEEAARGFVKVLTVPGKDKIIGVTIVGLHAGDWIAEYVLAMKNNIGLNKILGTIHIYPTLAEANKSVAGQWKQAHVSPRTLKLAESFNRWRRS